MKRCILGIAAILAWPSLGLARTEPADAKAPVKMAKAGASRTGTVYVHLAIYDIKPGTASAFEAALAASRKTISARSDFINERMLKNLDEATLQYATYTKFSDKAAAEAVPRARIEEKLLTFCRRPPETHVLKQTDAYFSAGITDRPNGHDFGEGVNGQIAHIGLFIPIPQYTRQYYEVLHETKNLTRVRRPEGYIGEDLAVEEGPVKPEKQTPYSPRPLELSPMSVNYGEYRTMENAEDSYIVRQEVRDQKLVTMERTFFSSLQVPTRFFIFQVFDNYGPQPPKSAAR